MRVLVAIYCLSLAGVQAFVPLLRPQSSIPSTTARPFGVDPTHFHEVSQQLTDAFSTLNLADAVEATADATTEVAKNDNGWFGFLAGPIESILIGIHFVLANLLGMSANSWGVSIIILTALIKLLTFPLTKSQLESTSKMQAMQPAVKELQAKYQSNPEVMNQKIAEFYQANEINPLAGCIPSLVQIPVFIGLYRAVLNLAQEDKLNEAFLWIPSLEGPTYGADPATASDWILKGWYVIW